jgi:signal transduction histidine kinase
MLPRVRAAASRRSLSESSATVLANRMAWLGIWLMVAWILTEAVLGTRTNLAIEAAATAGLFAVPVLRALGFDLACRVAALLAGNLAVLVGAVLYEPGNGGLVPFVPLVGLPMLLLHPDEIGWRWLGALLPVAAAVLLDAHGPGPILGIPRAEAPPWHHTANLGSALVLSGLQVAWLVRPKPAEVQLRERDVVTAVASHELRTPATALSLQVALLKRALAGREDLDARAAGLLRACESTSRQLVGLVDTLYDLARMRAGKVQLEPCELDLADVARRVVEMVDVRRFDDGGRVRVHAPEPVVGRWDRVRVEQALTNLVSNALKYGGDGTVDVTVERAGRTARVEVRDRGIGIPIELQEKVFLPFQRSDVTEASFEGLGLGLYVVREIVEAHGGRVRVSSAVGEGSRFTVELPLGV